MMSFSTVRRLKGIQKDPRKCWGKKKKKGVNFLVYNQHTSYATVLAKTLMQICHMHDQRGI